MSSTGTIPKLLDAGAADASALSAVAGAPLSYAALRAFIGRMGGHLAAQGITPEDRVAIVLDNGPEMAAAFLAVASAASAAPLNPAYRAEEFEFYLNDLDARLLITSADQESPALAVAQRLGIPVARLHPKPELGAGSFALDFGPFPTPHSPLRIPDSGLPTPESIALVLHTSGTTSRPKLVPLSHQNLVTSARNVCESLALTADDKGLVIMPLFHIHGLVAALLAPLAAGGEVCCTPGFNALKFLAWLADTRPTWYTGVPTMHQTVLLRAAKHPDTLAGHELRFIRSSSAALPATVIAELERIFRVPVVEAYGMTEAAHQIASNPLPPGPRKPGSVGMGTGVEVAIMGEAGRLLGAGEIGEVVLKGATIISAYHANPEADAAAYAGGWFRTGDRGYLDADGYLFLTGRLKELINRGGEKIAPLEVDEVLLRHPSVAQAVAFAVPHATLGEEVGAAVVLAEGRTATERELRDFVASRLADFKVPRTIVFVSELPKGPTGKLQRIGLARVLGLAGPG